jgi:Uma2 family endonuclease
MNQMAGATHRKSPPLSRKAFRAFTASRPDEERWELVDGVAVMMTPPTKAHQRIASNLETLLLNALEGHAPHLTAYQRLGVNLGPEAEHYDPEPDVIVIDAEIGPEIDERYADRFYLAAEVVSSSDRTFVEAKREIYRQHEACKCVLVVQQNQFEVSVDLRTDSGSKQQLLSKPDDLLVLADFGLRCALSDLYRGTALQPRHAPKR